MNAKRPSPVVEVLTALAAVVGGRLQCLRTTWPRRRRSRAADEARQVAAEAGRFGGAALPRRHLRRGLLRAAHGPRQPDDGRFTASTHSTESTRWKAFVKARKPRKGEVTVGEGMPRWPWTGDAENRQGHDDHVLDQRSGMAYYDSLPDSPPPAADLDCPLYPAQFMTRNARGEEREAKDKPKSRQVCATSSTNRMQRSGTHRPGGPLDVETRCAGRPQRSERHTAGHADPVLADHRPTAGRGATDTGDVPVQWGVREHGVAHS